MNKDCGCRKGSFTSRRRAEKAMHKAGGERVYFCKVAGAWHITRYTREEIDQLWAQRLKSS